jgi:hypothetical protein
MRSFLILLTLGATALSASAADEAAAQTAAQKKVAAANWEVLEIGEAAHLETKHLLIYAPMDMEKRLKAIGVVLEKYHDLAWNALAFDPKEDALPGKVTVYLFPQRDAFTAFVRRVEKRRLIPEETSSFVALGDAPHAAAGPARVKQAPGLEAQAGGQIAAVLLARKAGVRTPLPDWLVAGFGRATYYRAAPSETTVHADRRKAAKLAAIRGAGDIWSGKVEAEEADALNGSLADFMAYGPGASKFAAFVVGFKPEENLPRKTAGQALDTANIAADRIEKAWKIWAASQR